jgi:FMN-dependent NADH-azoreductase
MLSRYFVEDLRGHAPTLVVDYLDLAIDTPPHVTAVFAGAAYTPEGERTAVMHQALAVSDALCARLLAADALVFAMPMYNFGMPSAFKAFVDAIVRQGVTYHVTPDGRYIGALGGRRVLFLTTRGADLRHGSPLAGMDALTPSLRAAFGFIGVDDPVFVDAQPVQFVEAQAREMALERARAELSDLARAWTLGALRSPDLGPGEAVRAA